MTATTDFDRLVTDWLETRGPADVRNGVVEVAVATAHGRRQRRGLRAWIARSGAGFPGRATTAFPTSRVIALALVALLILALVTALVVGGRIILPTRPDVLGSFDGVLEPLGHLAGNREDPTLVTLTDGRVLIVGGAETGRPAEVLDPGTGRVAPVGSDEPDGPITAVRLLDGRVLVFGWTYGEPAATGRPDVQVFDPATDTFTNTGPMTTSRFAPSVILLRDGRVLVSGGVANQEAGPVLSAELFDPATDSFAPAGWPGPWLLGQTTVQLDDGRILLAGGCSLSNGGLNGGESCAPAQTLVTIDPATGRSLPVATMTSVRTSVGALRLSDGRVLLYTRGAGVQYFGRHGIDPVVTDIFDPRTNSLTAGPPLPHAVTIAASLSDGRAFLTGAWSLYRGLVSSAPGLATPGASSGDYIVDQWIGLYDPRTGASVTSPDPLGGGTRFITDTDTTYGSAAVLPNDRVVLVNGAEVDIFH